MGLKKNDLLRFAIFQNSEIRLGQPGNWFLMTASDYHIDNDQTGFCAECNRGLFDRFRSRTCFRFAMVVIRRRGALPEGNAQTSDRAKTRTKEFEVRCLHVQRNLRVQIVVFV
jgi:hypothetical protein